MLLFSPLIFYSNIENKIIAFVIFLTMLFDLIEKKKIVSHIFFLFFTLYQPNEIIFCYSFFLFFFTIFEPGIDFKKIKIALITFIFFINLNYMSNFEIFINFQFIIISFLLMIITIHNFIRYNSNFNWMYCLPSFSIIFFINNDIIISYISLILCLLIPYIFDFFDKKIFLKKNI